MLINFQVSNFKSIYEPATLSLLKGDTELLPHHVQKEGNLELLRFAAIYGANGAGKSNFLSAFHFLRTFIISEEHALNAYTFIEKEEEPICFIVELIINDRCYTYKLKIDIFSEIQIIEEIINENFTNNQVQELYKFDPQNKIFSVPNHYTSTEEDRSRVKIYSEEILSDSLSILSQFRKYNDPYNELNIIYNWFNDAWIFGEVVGSLNLIPTYSDNENLERLSELMKELNTGILDVQISSVQLDDFDFEANDLIFSDKLRKVLKETNFVNVKNTFMEVLVTNHKSPEVKYLIFKHILFNEEQWLLQRALSEGTRRLLTLIPVFEKIRLNKSVVFFDEIERSIHPLLVKQLISYLSKQTDFQGQVVFTTHHMDLLNSDVLRQDEIWFAEKNSSGSTNLVSLMEYDIDFLNNKNWAEAYQDGRFGAIPPKKIKQLAS